MAKANNEKQAQHEPKVERERERESRNFQNNLIKSKRGRPLLLEGLESPLSLSQMAEL